MKVLIVGSGIAGIASGIRLANEGHEVHIFESSESVGGKLASLKINGYRFDLGPSLFTLPELVDELFIQCKKNPRSYFNYVQLEDICRYFWEDGRSIKATADYYQFCKDAAREFGIPEKKLINYFSKATKKFSVSAPVFLDESLHLKKNYFRRSFFRGILYLPFLNLFSSMHRYNQKKLKEKHLVQLFDRFATYNGSNPYSASAILTMIPHLEHQRGAFFPKEGMYAIVDSLKKLALEKRVQFHLNAKVKKILISNKTSYGLLVQQEGKENEHHGDIVISNADVYSTYKNLIQDDKKFNQIKKQERSSSALIFYWGLPIVSNQLGVHNILFSNNYQSEFTNLFKDQKVFQDPTVYIHISSKINPEDAPANCENWFVMINVPGKKITLDQRLEYRSIIIKKINRILGLDIESKIQAEHFLSPEEIELRTSSHLGSLYGTSSNTRSAAFFRHPNFSKNISNLYFCGGSVHPGGGIPLALKSAKIVSSIILDRHAK